MPPPPVSAAACPSVEPQPHARTSWEEPHPGQRIAHVIESAQPAWGHARDYGSRLRAFAASGEHRDGMAAKGMSLRYSYRPWAVRRSILMRSRTGAPRPLKLPLFAAFDGGSKSAPIVCSAERLVSSPASASTVKASTAPTSPAATLKEPDLDMATVLEGGMEAGMEADMEADMDGATTCTDATETDGSSPSSSPPPPPLVACALNDVSNFLGASTGPAETHDDAVTIVDSEPDSLCVLSSGLDAYGWEAELERKLRVQTERLCTPDEGPDAVGMSGGQPRRNLWRRGNLLHRVISLGKADELARQLR
jgi:hypothetical protein